MRLRQNSNKAPNEIFTESDNVRGICAIWLRNWSDWISLGGMRRINSYVWGRAS